MTAKVRNFEIYMQIQKAKHTPPSLERKFGGGYAIKRIYTRLPKWVVHTGVALYTQWSYILNMISWLVQAFTKRRFRTHLLLSLLLVGGLGGYHFYMFRELPWKQLGIVFAGYWVILIVLLIFRNKIRDWKDRTWGKVICLKGTGTGFRGYVVINPKCISEITPEMEAEIREGRQLLCMDLFC